MIRMRLTEMVGIRHPIVLGGMARATSAELVAAVSNAGGLGVMGMTFLSADEIRSVGERISALTRTPFGLNLLVFAAPDSRIDAVLACVRVLSSPPVPLVERLAADTESVLRTRSRELIG